MRRLVIALVVALAGLSCQRTETIGDLDEAIEKARAVQRDDGPRAALPMLERLLRESRTRRSRRHEGLVLGHLGTAYKNLADYPRAMSHHEAALAIKRELGDEVEQAKTLNNIGLVEEARGNCPRALEVFGQSLAIFTRHDEPRFAASVLNNEALCYDALGRFDRSMANYEQALGLHRAARNEIGESESLGNIGGVHLLLGRYREAAARYEDSLAISTRLDVPQSMALDLINLGAARIGAGDFNAAAQDLGKARLLAKNAGLPREEADAARGLSRLAEARGRYDDARAALADAQAIYEKTGLAREQIDAAHDLGLLDLSVGDLGSAIVQFTRASDAAARLDYFTGRVANLLALAHLELRRGNLDGARRNATTARDESGSWRDVANVASASTLLARVHLAASRGEAAMASAREGLEAARRTGGTLLEADARHAVGDALRALGRPSEAVAESDAGASLTGVADVPDLVWRLQLGRGRALEALHRLDDALREYLASVETIERTRRLLATDRARSGYLDDKREAYGALLRLLLRLKRPADAFQVAERLRAEGYRELVMRSAALARTPAAVPADVLERIRHLQRSIEHELRQTPTERRGTALTAYRDELRAAESAWAAAVDALTARAPWARPAASTQAPTASAVRQRLAGSDALVQFVVDTDETVAFVLRRHAIHAEILPVSGRTLRTRVELLRGLLARHDSSEWQAPAERLDAELMEPLRRGGWLDGVTRLFLVPHAELNYLPFAVLRRRQPQGAQLLVEDLSLVVLPAATVLVQAHVTRAPAAGALLALAPERPRLPFARREVESLSALFPRERRSLLLGPAATEARFKHDAGRYRIVHLATHGFFNRINPLFSGVDLEADVAEDGRLQVFEILGLSLAVDLVTLSACDTALGAGELTDLPAGEELVGLTRAFLSAGSRHVLATLWEINDEATAPFMEEFYRVARGRPTAEALAQVMRRRLRGGGREAHPYYWAPFVLVGAAPGAETARVGP